MIGLVLSAAEVRSVSAGTPHKIRRPLKDLPANPKNVRYCPGFYLKCDAPPGSKPASLRIPCPWGDPHPDEADEPSHLLFVQEAWRSWVENCDGIHGLDDEDPSDALCTASCHQTYVAYASTPRQGYRPEPDRATITFLNESTPLYHRPELLGPWESPDSMPPLLSRMVLRNRGVRVLFKGGIWQWSITVEAVVKPNGVPFRPAEVPL